MFDIGFSELVLVFVIGLVVLGPERLPVAVKTVAGWVRALRSLATTVQSELSKELKLQEFQDSLKKVEKASLDNLTPELKASMEELREAAESMKRSYTQTEPEPEQVSDEANTIHNPVVKNAEADREGVTPGAADSQAQSPAQKPQPVVEETAAVKPEVEEAVVNTPVAEVAEKTLEGTISVKPAEKAPVPSQPSSDKS